MHFQVDMTNPFLCDESDRSFFGLEPVAGFDPAKVTPAQWPESVVSKPNVTFFIRPMR
jgi:hypothetical protein